MRDTATSHEDALRRALADEVADVHPRHMLPEILDGAGHRGWLCLWILLGTVGALLLIAAGLLMLAGPGSQPAPKIPAHLTRLLEA